jgi:hypothetical protein
MHRPALGRGEQLVLLLAGMVFASLVASPDAAAAGGECPRFASGSRGLPTVGEWRTHPAVADVNGDGKPDIAALARKSVGPTVWLGDGKGAWKSASTGLLVPEGSCGVGVDLADVNEDGKLDLGVADHCQGLFVFFGDGKGVWKLGPTVTRELGRGYEDMAFTDLNRDGHVDLVAISSSRDGLVAYMGDGQGRWKLADVGLPDSGSGADLKVGDLNGDGRPDIAASFVAAGQGSKLPPESSHNVVWLSQPSGRFEPSSRGIPNDAKWWGVALGDVNGDGRLDVALSSDHWPDRPSILVYLGDGGTSWKPAVEGLPTPKDDLMFEGVELADLDGDRHLDLIAVSHMDAGIRVWMGDGQGKWRECKDTGLPEGRTTLRGWGLAVQDLNGDQRPDLVVGVGREGKGGLEVWFNRKR